MAININKFRLNTLWEELIIYSLAVLYSILVAMKLNSVAIFSFDKQSLTLGQFFLFFFLATLVFLCAVRYAKGDWLWQAIFGLGVFSGTEMVLSLFFPEYAAIILAGLLLFVRFKRPEVFWHNLLVFLGVVGIASFFGSGLRPYSVVVMLLILSAYDFVAVYKTKHMVEMAVAMLEHRAILAFILPFRWKDWFADLRVARPGEDFMVVGAGDVALPLLLVVSLLNESLAQAIFVSFFVVWGALVNHFIFTSQKKARPIPGLPVLTFFSILGFFVSLWLT